MIITSKLVVKIISINNIFIKNLNTNKKIQTFKNILVIKKKMILRLQFNIFQHNFV